MPSMPGHLDVEEHEIGRLALGQRDAFLAGRGQDAFVAFVARWVTASMISTTSNSHSHFNLQFIATTGTVVQMEQHGLGRLRRATRPSFSIARLRRPRPCCSICTTPVPETLWL